MEAIFKKHAQALMEDAAREIRNDVGKILDEGLTLDPEQEGSPLSEAKALSPKRIETKRRVGREIERLAQAPFSRRVDRFQRDVLEGFLDRE